MSATMIDKAPPRRLAISISKDRMQAEIRPHGDQRPTVLSHVEIAQMMADAGLPAFAEADLKALVGDADPLSIEETLVVARGAPPVDDVPARLDPLKEPPADPDAPISHYDRHHFLMVAEGQVIGRVIPRVVGRDGIDVFGKPVPRKRPADIKFTLGANVAMSPDGTSVVSRIAGRLKTEGAKIWVEPMLDIPRHVDFSVGNIDFAGDVHIRGNVLDLFHVRSGSSVLVDGAVEAAEIVAGANVLVRGGIVGKEKGRCIAGGNVGFKYASNATIRAGGDVCGHVEILHSRVDCGGTLNIHTGSIVGSTIRARGGVKAAVLGNAAAAATLIEAGGDPSFRQRVVEDLPKLRALQKKIASLREQADPLIKGQRHLAAAQREKLTELLFEVEEAESAAAEIVERLRKAHDAARAASRQEVHVLQRIYPGVTIRFPEIECTFAHEMAGPMLLVPRTIGNDLCVAAVMQQTGGAHRLASKRHRDDVLHLAELALAHAPQSKPRHA